MSEYWHGALNMGLPMGLLVGALAGKWVMQAAQRRKDAAAFARAVEAQRTMCGIKSGDDGA